MTKTCYEYEVGGTPQRLPTTWSKWETKWISYDLRLPSGLWDQAYIRLELHLTVSCNIKCWNTLYMYEEDQMWVWSGSGASIISELMLQAKDQVNRLLLPLWLRVQAYRYQVVEAASLRPLAAIERAEMYYIYMTKTCYEYEVGGTPQTQT